MATATGYSFYGGVREAILCKDREVILSGPAETGKTLGLLWKLNVIAHKYKGASLVMARKTLESTYSTVLVTFQKKVLQPGNKTGTYASGIRAYGGEKPQWFDYPSGSRIWMAGMDKSSKVLSAEHDIIYVNQCEELSLPDWEVLTTRCTGRAGNIPNPQMIGDCNPAAPTHWIRSRAQTERLTLIENTHFDNPTLFDPKTGEITEQGERTFKTLDALTGARYSRLRQGLWAAPEGAIYSVFDEERHKVRAFNVPHLWPRIVGIDPLGAYVVALWLALDPVNRVLNVYREYYEPFGAATPAHARKIIGRCAGETIFAWIGGGPAERAARTDWSAAGIPLLEPPIKDVWLGIDRVSSLLADHSLVIHDSCPNLLSEIGSYVRKQGRDGVFEDRIVNKDRFHCLDALRYVVSWLAEPHEQETIMYNPIQIGNY